MMKPVSTDLADGILTITLDRPEQGNAIDMALAEALLEAARAAASDPAVRCVVLAGAGRMLDRKSVV